MGRPRGLLVCLFVHNKNRAGREECGPPHQRGPGWGTQGSAHRSCRRGTGRFGFFQLRRCRAARSRAHSSLPSFPGFPSTGQRAGANRGPKGRGGGGAQTHLREPGGGPAAAGGPSRVLRSRADPRGAEASPQTEERASELEKEAASPPRPAPPPSSGNVRKRNGNRSSPPRSPSSWLLQPREGAAPRRGLGVPALARALPSCTSFLLARPRVDVAGATASVPVSPTVLTFKEAGDALGSIFEFFLLGQRSELSPPPPEGRVWVSAGSKIRKSDWNVLSSCRGDFATRGHPAPVMSPALWALPHGGAGPPPPVLQSAPQSAGAPPCPGAGRTGRCASASSPGPNPQVSTRRSVSHQRPRVARCHCNNQCDARKLPTSCCYAIVRRPACTAQHGGRRGRRALRSERQ